VTLSQKELTRPCRFGSRWSDSVPGRELGPDEDRGLSMRASVGRIGVVYRQQHFLHPLAIAYEEGLWQEALQEHLPHQLKLHWAMKINK